MIMVLICLIYLCVINSFTSHKVYHSYNTISLLNLIVLYILLSVKCVVTNALHTYVLNDWFYICKDLMEGEINYNYNCN
jgi:hypothetical protein